MILFKRKNLFLIDKKDRMNFFLIFRSIKVLEEKYVEAKKAFEINKSQLSQIEHRVLF